MAWSNYFYDMIFYFGSKVFSNLYEKGEFIFGPNFSQSKVEILIICLLASLKMHTILQVLIFNFGSKV
jgi:hypothetical protein